MQKSFGVRGEVSMVTVNGHRLDQKHMARINT